jgi:hypothetical protein
MKEGKFIDLWVETHVRVGCPYCGTHLDTSIGNDDESEEFRCNICENEYLVRFWDNEKDEPITPENGEESPY